MEAKGKVLPIPTLLGPEGFEQAMLFWVAGGRPECAGTPGHPVPPSLSHPDVGPLTALSAPQFFLDVQCMGVGS